MMTSALLTRSRTTSKIQAIAYIHDRERLPGWAYQSTMKDAYHRVGESSMAAGARTLSLQVFEMPGQCTQSLFLLAHLPTAYFRAARHAIYSSPSSVRRWL